MEQGEWEDVVADLWTRAWDLGFLPTADDAAEGVETRRQVAYAQDKSPHEFIEEEIRLYLHHLLDLTREERNQVIEEWRTGKPGSIEYLRFAQLDREATSILFLNATLRDQGRYSNRS